MTINNSIKEQIIDIVTCKINEIKTDDWDDAREQLIYDLLDLDFCKLIYNFECGLYFSTQEFTDIIQNSLFKLSNFFVNNTDAQISIPIPKQNILKEDLDNLLALAVKILCKRQECVYYTTKFSTCPNPELPVTEKCIEKIEKFIKKEKFNREIIIKRTRLYSQLTTSQTIMGEKIYRKIINMNIDSPYCEIFASPFDYNKLFYLYKAVSGKIYVLYSFSGVIIMYSLVEDESWFMRN